MARTFASFRWDLQIPEDAEQPFAKADVTKLVDALRLAGANVGAPQDGEYAWDFTAKLPHIRMDCKLGLVEGQKWLLSCYPWRGWVDWLRRNWREDEQESFIKLAESALRSDPRITGVQWHSQQEWDRTGA